jgi:hypothetical protein
MNKSENLKFILERYDHYIESVQSKSNLYIALNSLIVTGSIAILTTVDSQKLNSTLLVLLIIIVLASIFSIIITLIALIPYLKTSQDKSVLFFKDVSNEKANDYCKRMNEMTSDNFDNDITNQIHCIAKGLTIKYEKMKWAGLLLIFQFVTIIIWTIIFIIKNK